MIKFFRQIRQRLLTENKTGKYFKYAIGEIVLVVIGILIALQVNNWNELEKSKLETKRLLINLKLDLEKDIENFHSLQEEYNDWLIEIQFILDDVLDGKEKVITDYNQLMAGRLSMNYLIINKITYSEMFDSGKQLNFDNLDVAQEIKNHYQYAENELIKLNADNEEFYRLLMSYYGVNGINSLNRIINNRNLEYLDWSWLSDPNSQEFINLETAMLLYKLVVDTNLEIISSLEKNSISLIDKIEKSQE
jgi:hypothetical protein